jgi:hypothetical protein
LLNFCCAGTGVGATFIAGGLAYDALLVEAGRENKISTFNG